MRVHAALVSVAAAVVAGALVGVPARRASADAPAPALAFSGRILVRWFDARGMHETAFPVSAKGGQLELTGSSPLWDVSRVTSPVAPTMSPKYQVRERPGPVIVGRSTREVTVSISGAPRQQVDYDEETGMVLYRAVYDASGAAQRTVMFTDLRVDPPGSASSGTAGPRTPRDSSPLARVRAPFVAPSQLLGGYQRVGIYRSLDGVHVLYSDGLDNISVFEEPGHLASKDLPSGSQAVELGSRQARSWPWAGGEIVTWQDGSTVVTAVGDGLLGDVVSAASSLPRTGPLSLAQRLRAGARRMLSDLAGAGRP